MGLWCRVDLALKCFACVTVEQVVSSLFLSLSVSQSYWESRKYSIKGDHYLTMRVFTHSFTKWVNIKDVQRALSSRLILGGNDCFCITIWISSSVFFFFFFKAKLLLILVLFHPFRVFVRLPSKNYLYQNQQGSLLKVGIPSPYFEPANSERGAGRGGIYPFTRLSRWIPHAHWRP